MALTRKMLKAMSIEDEKIDQIIEAHIESTDALKAERDVYKEKAESLAKTQEELESVQKQLNELKEGDTFEEKYNQEHEAFESFKAEVESNRLKAQKEQLYRALLQAEKIDPKRIDTILKVTDLEGLEVEDDALKDAENLTETIRKEWSDFIPQTGTEGAKVATPPTNGGTAAVDLEKMSIEDYVKYRKAN